MENKPTLDDFPFDPQSAPEELRGLDKLRAIEDPTLRKLTYELYVAMEANEQKADFQQRIRAAEREKVQVEIELLNQMADRAHAGGFGVTARELARHLVPLEQPRTPALLRELQRKIRALPREARR